MADPNSKYEDYAKSVKTVLLLAGLWPGPAPFARYRYIIIFLIIMDLFIIMATMNCIYTHLDDISLLTRAMGFCVTSMAALLKTTMYLTNRARLAKMHWTLETTFRYEYSKEELQKILLAPLSIFTQVSWIVVRLYLAIPFLHCLGPPISIILQLIHGEKKLEYFLPFLGEYPWNATKNFVVFFFMYLSECMSGYSAGMISASTDAAFVFYVFQISTQFRVLSYEIANLKSTDDYNTIIKRCIEKHRTLVDCCECLQRIYGPVVLWFMISSAINLCANIYQITKVNTDEMIPSLVFIMGKLIQTMVYAWFGTFLSTQSEAFCNAVYNCDWPGSGKKSLMTNVLIMLMGKPVALSACSFSTISLDMFVGIVNTALSYFFLLQTLEE